MSIREALGETAAGIVVDRSHDDAAQWLRENVRTDSEANRKARAAERLDLYHDRCHAILEVMVDRVFKNTFVKEKRKELLEYAKFQNVTRRIVNELSTVYSQPAMRLADGGETYIRTQELIRKDRTMATANAYWNLLNGVLLYPRLNQRTRLPQLRIITPDSFWPVPHPLDPAEAVGYVLEQVPRGIGVRDTDPHFLVMDDSEFFWLDKNWHVIGGLIQSHNLGRIPVTLASRGNTHDRPCVLE